MPREARADEGGLVYHVLNRGNAQSQVFLNGGDYRTFERVLEQGLERVAMRVLAYCLMPNHWHLILWPREDGDLSKYMHWVELTHTQRWHAFYHTTGRGHLYQGRYKSFVVQTDEHFLSVCRYVERNPMRARLVRLAENWQWSSLWRRVQGLDVWLSPWPVDAPSDWVEQVHRPQTAEELERIRCSIQRGRPYGSPAWQARTARRLGLESTLRSRGRPRKKKRRKKRKRQKGT